MWGANYTLFTVSKFLGIIPEKTCVLRKSYGSLFYKNSIVVALDDFLKENNLVIKNNLGLSDNDVYAVGKEDIEISSKVFKRCMTTGLIFIKSKSGDKKWVISFVEGYRTEAIWGIEVFYDEKRADDVKDFIERLELFSKEHSYLKNKKLNPSLEHIDLATNYTWDDVILPEKIKKELDLNIGGLIKKIDTYKQNGIRFKRGIILKGVPGTGKTLLAKIICASVQCTFLWVTPMYLQHAVHIRNVCKLARELSPCILFLEDIDLYGADRSQVGDASLLGELMNQLDGLVENHFIIVIATTNDVQILEGALRNRPGRFDRIIDIPIPNYDDRLLMLQHYTKSYELLDIDLPKIAKNTTDYTGAHVKELVNTALMVAIDENSLSSAGKVVLKHRHFQDNIQKVKEKKIQAVGFGMASVDDSAIIDNLSIDPLHGEDL
jgi:cell division protease FtsH